MAGTVIGFAGENLFNGLVAGAFAFAFFTAIVRTLFNSWIFDFGAGNFLGFVPALACIILGTHAYLSFQPPVLDWSIRAIIVFLFPAVIAIVSAIPFARFFDDPGVHRRHSQTTLAASVGLVYGGVMPTLVTFLALQGADLRSLVSVPIY